MTDYIAAPVDEFDIDGNMTGTVNVVWNGNGRVYVQSDAIDYRGSNLRVSLHLFRDDEGDLNLHDMHDSFVPVRRGMDPAPKTYVAKVIERIIELVDANWSTERDEQGTDAAVARDLNRAEGELETAYAAYREARATVRQLQAQRRCTTCWERHRPVDYCQRDGRSHV